MSPLPITRALKVGAHRSHLEGLKQKDMEGYLKHYLEIAGIKEELFYEEAILTIHQGLGRTPAKGQPSCKGFAHYSSTRESNGRIGRAPQGGVDRDILVMTIRLGNAGIPSGQIIATKKTEDLFKGCFCLPHGRKLLNVPLSLIFVG